jgi:hypothetical protein
MDAGSELAVANGPWCLRELSTLPVRGVPFNHATARELGPLWSPGSVNGARREGWMPSRIRR